MELTTTTIEEPASATVGCMVGASGSVEARFGLTDCRPTDSGGNRCGYVVPPWARDAQGRVRVGALMVLADHILGELPYVRRPPGTWSLTSELTLDVIGEISSAELYFAQGRNLTVGANVFVQCTITDAEEKLLAVGTTRCAYVPGGGEDPVADVSGRRAQPAVSTDIDQVLGLDYHHDSDGLHVTLADPGGWVNGFGIMHGGVSACVTELAASAAVARQNSELSTAHVHTSYLRPVVVGAPFVAVARPYHVGRSSAVVEVLGCGGGGQLCTVSTVTARRPGSTQPGRPAQPMNTAPPSTGVR